MRTAAGVFEAAACSIALIDRTTGELVYQAAWGAGAKEIVGVRLPPGTGIAGAVVASGEGDAVPDCRNDPRFAAQIAAGTGLRAATRCSSCRSSATTSRSACCRSSTAATAGLYGADDMERAALFAELAVTALDVDPGAFTSLGETRLGTRASG